jgi:hypothetical protein
MFWPCFIAVASLQMRACCEPQIPYPCLVCESCCPYEAPSIPERTLATPAVPDDEAGRAHTFAELTLFLLAGGVALFVALLGWSDQIRGINQDTRDLERAFLEATGIDRQTFLSVVKSTSPTENLEALTQLLASGKLKTVSGVEALQIFQTWNRKWVALERLSAWKYGLSIALTYSLFVGGLLSLLITPHSEVYIFQIRASAPLLILVIPMVGFLGILTIIAVANHREAYFRTLLKTLSEKV